MQTVHSEYGPCNHGLPQVLEWLQHDFDTAMVSLTCPVLITHLTGSSIGSPVISFTSGACIVGKMTFNPSQMCWISCLPPEEDESDVFMHLADEDEDDWEHRGGTIHASQPLDQSLMTAATCRDTLSPRQPMSIPSLSILESKSE